MIAKLFRFMALFTIGTGFMLLILASFQLFYYTFTPMSWWAEYNSATVIGQGPEAILVVNRRIKMSEPIPVRIYAELHAKLADHFQLDQWCESSQLVTAEPDTGPIVNVPVRDLLRPTCSYTALPCEPMQLQVIVELSLPYSVMKRRRFLSEPYYPAPGCASSAMDQNYLNALNNGSSWRSE